MTSPRYTIPRTVPDRERTTPTRPPAPDREQAPARPPAHARLPSGVAGSSCQRASTRQTNYTETRIQRQEIRRSRMALDIYNLLLLAFSSLYLFWAQDAYQTYYSTKLPLGVLHALAGFDKRRGFHSNPRTTFKGEARHAALSTIIFPWIEGVKEATVLASTVKKLWTCWKIWDGLSYRIVLYLLVSIIVLTFSLT